jgi:hypothetical protein
VGVVPGPQSADGGPGGNHFSTPSDKWQVISPGLGATAVTSQQSDHLSHRYHPRPLDDASLRQFHQTGQEFWDQPDGRHRHLRNSRKPPPSRKHRANQIASRDHRYNMRLM